MDKIKKWGLCFIIAILTSIILYDAPLFFGIKKQYNVTNINPKNHIVIETVPKKIDKIQISSNQNIPLPENVKKRMIEEEKKKKEEQERIERLQREENERLEKERIEKEQLEKQEQERLAAIKEQEKQKITNRSEKTERSNEGWIKFCATYYCPCSSCCGKSTGVTASGSKARAGVTVAMPSNYALGTKVLLKDTGGNILNNGNPYIVQDRGGAIKSNKIDIFVNSHSEALRMGRNTVYLKVVD